MKAAVLTGSSLVVLALLLIFGGMLNPLNPTRPEIPEVDFNLDRQPQIPPATSAALPRDFHFDNASSSFVFAKDYTGGVVFEYGQSKISIMWRETESGGCQYKGDFYSNGGNIVFDLPPIVRDTFCNVDDALSVLDELIARIDESKTIAVEKLIAELDTLYGNTQLWFMGLIP